MRPADRSLSAVQSLSWSPSGTSLAAAGSDPRVRVWTGDGDVRTIATRHAAVLNAVAWSPAGDVIATASDDGTVRLHDAATGAARQILAGHSGPVNDLAWSPDGSWVVSVSTDGTADIWDAVTGSLRSRLTGHVGAWVCCAAAPDGASVVTGGDDGQARVWDLASGRIRSTLRTTGTLVLSAAWSPDGSQVATLDDAGNAQVWDPDDERAISVIPLSPDPRWMAALAYSPDGRTLAATGPGGDVLIWDALTGTVRRRYAAGTAGVTALAWSPDRSSLAVGDLVGDVRILDAASGAWRAGFRLGAPVTVFVSQSSRGPTTALLIETLIQRLRDWGVEPWIDREQIVAGTSWREPIEAAIAGSDAAIIVVTDAYLTSEWAAWELDALLGRRPRLPVLILLATDRAAAADPRLRGEAQLQLDLARSDFGLDRVEPWIRRLLAPSDGEDPRVAKTRARNGFLHESAAGIPINRIADGAPMAVPEQGLLPAYPLAGGGTITLLAPDREALRRVAARWRDNLEKAGLQAPPTAQDDPLRGAREAREASLAFLVEYEGTGCLVTGSAAADRLERALHRLLRERGLTRLAVDIMVLPHHAGRSSLTADLLNLIDCARFVVSTSGAVFGHPDQATIALLGAGRAQPPTVYFNYRSASTERYADPEIQRRLNIVAVFPDQSRPGITIAVPAPDRDLR